jgi:hypothetical protein
VTEVATMPDRHPVEFAERSPSGYYPDSPTSAGLTQAGR